MFYFYLFFLFYFVKFFVYIIIHFIGVIIPDENCQNGGKYSGGGKCELLITIVNPGNNNNNNNNNKILVKIVIIMSIKIIKLKTLIMRII